MHCNKIFFCTFLACVATGNDDNGTPKCITSPMSDHIYKSSLTPVETHSLTSSSFNTSSSLPSAVYISSSIEQDDISDQVKILNDNMQYLLHIFIGSMNQTRTHVCFSLNFKKLSKSMIPAFNQLALNTTKYSYITIKTRTYKRRPQFVIINHADLVINSICSELESIKSLLNWTMYFDSFGRIIPLNALDHIPLEDKPYVLDQVLYVLFITSGVINSADLTEYSSDQYRTFLNFIYIHVNALCSEYNIDFQQSDIFLRQIQNILYIKYCNIVNILKIHSFKLLNDHVIIDIMKATHAIEVRQQNDVARANDTHYLDPESRQMIEKHKSSDRMKQILSYESCHTHHVKDRFTSADDTALDRHAMTQEF